MLRWFNLYSTSSGTAWLHWLLSCKRGCGHHIPHSSCTPPDTSRPLQMVAHPSHTPVNGPRLIPHSPILCMVSDTGTLSQMAPHSLCTPMHSHRRCQTHHTILQMVAHLSHTPPDRADILSQMVVESWYIPPTLLYMPPRLIMYSHGCWCICHMLP